MNKFIITLLFAFLVAAPLAAQGTLDGLDLSTGINGSSPDASDKTLYPGDLLSFRVDDNGSGTVGNLLTIAADLVPAGFPICLDLDGNAATCELNLGSNIFFLVMPDPASPLNPVLTSAGFQTGLALPADASIFSLVDDEAIRLQAATANPASPIGFSITNFIDHLVGGFEIAGPTGDDNNVEIDLGTGFPFYGTTYNSVFINANGNLTFGSPDTDWNATAGEMLSDQARIAPAWHDVSPNVGGSVTANLVRGAGNTLVSLNVFWSDVPGYQVLDLNSFGTTLHANGDIDCSVLNVSANDTFILGISPGGGLSTASELPIVGGGVFPGASNEALFEELDGSDCANNQFLAAGLNSSFIYDGVDAYTLTTTTNPAETFSSLSPDQGFETGGETITLSGLFDTGASYEVTFGANAPVAATVLDACTLEVVAPANAIAPEVVDVTVTNTGTTNSLTLVGAYTYNQAGVNSGSFSLSDDGNGLLTLGIAPTSVTFYGNSYTELYVNANGNITFGSSDSDWTESESEFLNDQPRIALFWTDCNPTNGGTVDFTETDTLVTVNYTNITAYNSGDNTASATINKVTGEITLSYGADCTSFSGTVSSNDVICGISSGGGLGITTPLIDLGTAGSTTAAGADDALFEWFNNGPLWDLNGASFGFTPTGGVGVGPYMHHNP